ncbi:hypothetical protein GWK47_009488 [Chionoecetes opilio]|uniref:Uncharacterized protein n=1 Tax=Chionoecetes opilio TaxID=41210 RepID=A0A8J4XZ47_CHIOP|nr:hypothetical protein GWK47_009488 [Chionoecetes opilio]
MNLHKTQHTLRFIKTKSPAPEGLEGLTFECSSDVPIAVSSATVEVTRGGVTAAWRGEAVRAPDCRVAQTTHTPLWDYFRHGKRRRLHNLAHRKVRQQPLPWIPPRGPNSREPHSSVHPSEEGSRSVTWYATATRREPLTLPPGLPPRVVSRLIRLCLGYRCASQILQTAPDQCPYCFEIEDDPLHHYILRCPVTQKTTTSVGGDAHHCPPCIARPPHCRGTSGSSGSTHARRPPLTLAGTPVPRGAPGDPDHRASRAVPRGTLVPCRGGHSCRAEGDTRAVPRGTLVPCRGGLTEA